MVIAVEKFFSESNSWLFPPTERRYREGIEAVGRYQDRLTGVAAPEAQFYAAPTTFANGSPRSRKRLGSMSRRLGNSVAANVINEELAGDPSAEAAQNQPDTIDVRTPWLEIDDVFFEARGTAWALLHFFRAAEFDFAQVLADKNAEASVSADHS